MSDELNSDLADEFLEIHPNLDGGDLEEAFMEYLRTVKSSSSGTITLYLSKVINGRVILDSIRSRTGARGRSPIESTASDTLEDFAKKALRAARAVDHKWHGQAFIFSAWEEMPGSMSLTDFKSQLLKAYRADLLVLTRADLVDAMPEDEVRKSELKYHSYSFHFIQLV